MRYDYVALKAEFFTSEYKSFQPFFKNKFWKIPSWNVNAKIKGWADDKETWKKNAVDDALEEIKTETKSALRPVVAELEGKLVNVLKLADLKVKALYDNAFENVYDKHWNLQYKTDAKAEWILDWEGARIPMTKLKDWFSARELKYLYDMIKTELGEPTTISNSRISDPSGKPLNILEGLEIEIVHSKYDTNKD